MKMRLAFIFLLTLGLKLSAFSASTEEMKARYLLLDDQEVQSIIQDIEDYPRIDSTLMTKYYNLAKYFWVNGDHYEVEWIANQMLEFSKDLKSEYWKAIHHNMKGNVLYRKGYLNECLEQYNQAILSYQAAGNQDRVSVMRNNLSVVYLDLENDSVALDQSLIALNYFLDSGSDVNLSQTYTNLGNVYSELGDTSRALESYMRSLELDIRQKDTFGISTAYTNIGTVYAENGNYGMAKIFFLNALSLDSIVDDPHSLMISNFNIGYNYLNQKEYKKAVYYLHKSLKKAKTLPSYSYILKNSKNLARAGKEIGESDMAIELLLSSLSLYDSLYSRERIQELNEIQHNFDIRQKEIENRLLRANQAKSDALLERQTLVSYLIIGGLFVALVLLFILWRNRNRIKQLNKLLKKANAEQNKNARQINKQKEKLQNANRENRELISLLIHDLKNPLSQIQLLSKMSLEDAKADIEEHSRLIHQASENALKLIDRISTAHLLEEGKLNPKFTQVNIGDLIAQIVEIFSTQASKKNINLELNGEGDTLFISDEKFLDNSLQNLLSNAIKFSPKKSIVKISYEQTEEGLRIKVRDEGPGFTQKDKELLFEKFQKLSASPTGGESSSGVGLPIAKSLIDRLGGKLYLNEEYRDGAEFIVDLPKLNLS